MFNKIYENTKKFMKENIKVILIYIVLIITLTYKLPFYIYTGGGVIDASKRVEVENGYTSDGKFYFAYVSSLYATIPTYLLAKIIPSWEIESIDSYQISSSEESDEIEKREKIYLESANNSAIYNAYTMSGKNIEIEKENLSVVYVDNKEKSELRVGDIIKKIDGTSISNTDELVSKIDNFSVDDILEIEIERNGKIKTVHSTVYEKDSKNVLGISVIKTYDYDLDPSLTLKFKSREAGPSGGLSLTLAIYNSLVEEDITKGRKIVATGTIDMDGNVGAIGGVIYKLRGAIKEKADIFIVPNDENYDEVIKVVNKEKLNIKVIGVDTFEDALNKLK